MKRILSIALLTLCLTFPAWALEAETRDEEPENYCDDLVSWAEWGEMVRKFPNDLDLQTLYALRIGLCAKIKDGTISTVDAIVLFERARAILVEKARQRELADEEHL